MKKSLFYTGLVSFIVAASTASLGLLLHHQLLQKDKITIEHVNHVPASQALYVKDESGNAIPLDFTKAAEKVMDAVVHIKSSSTARLSNNMYQPFPQDDFFRDSPFKEFFGPRFYQQKRPRSQKQPPMKMGQGSGVIISENGYIITNNHVIDEAEELEVTLYDKRTYKATVVGTDPSTDLALLQIKEESLPFLRLANSDAVKVGEWVLAVGNPFSLNSTVTAGIVSAKGRNINILKEQFAVESFIQTDAAINPGNSGGALVNLEGGLVGINTAIASPTGAYSGYGFAIPTSIVNKVVGDLLEYGVVQRGVLGVTIRTVDGNLKKQKDISVLTGAYVDSLLENSAAGAGGILAGDVITHIGDVVIESSPKLQEVIAQFRPGDKVDVTVNRKGKKKVLEVVLKNRRGDTRIVDKEHKALLDVLGAQLETLSEKEAVDLDIKGGVKVTDLYRGKLSKQTEMRKGFIITHIDGKQVATAKEVIKKLEHKKGGVLLEGIYADLPGKYYYALGL